MAGIDPKFYYLTLGLLALCTLVGLFVAYRFQREVNDDLAPPTERDLLGPLEKAYYSGLMREEEFERIQESMAKAKGGTLARSEKPRTKPTLVEGQGPTPGPEAGPAGGEALPPITPTGDSDPDLGPG